MQPDSSIADSPIPKAIPEALVPNEVNVNHHCCHTLRFCALFLVSAFGPLHQATTFSMLDLRIA